MGIQKLPYIQENTKKKKSSDKKQKKKIYRKIKGGVETTPPLQVNVAKWRGMIRCDGKGLYESKFVISNSDGVV